MNDSDTKLMEAVLQLVKRGACKVVEDLLAPIGIDARAKMIAADLGIDEHDLFPQMGAAFVEQEVPIAIAVKQWMKAPPKQTERTSIYQQMRELLDAGVIKLKPGVVEELMKQCGVRLEK